MLRALIILFLFLALLAGNAWITSQTRWQWELQLVTLELGHWLALACLLVLILICRRWHGRQCFIAIGAFSALAGVFMIPARQAAEIAAREHLEFSWFKLWTPFLSDGGYEVRQERRTFWSEGGESLDMVIHSPVYPEEALPCILIAHSGGWDGGDPGEFAWANESIASHGYAVCSFGYRLAPEHRWPAQAEDTRRAVAWVREHAREFGIDPDQLVLMGRSAGAQIASACAYSMPELKVRACVSIYGPSDMVFARQVSYPDDILKSLTLVHQYMGGDPAQLPDVYRTASATQFISAQSPPTLLIHGSLDALVWVEHSRRMSRLLAHRDDHHFLELPWGTHGCDYFASSPGGQLSMSALLRMMEQSYSGTP
jgi:acetyl esterase/lipase